jgi:hypothetical protein
MIESMEKYWKEKKEYDETHKVQMVKIIPTNSPTFNLPILKQNIDNIDNMTDKELDTFIFRNYKTILNNMFEGDTTSKYITKLQDTRVLDSFIKLFSSMRFIDSDDSIRINTLCYHYITLPKDKQDDKILHRMLQLTSVVNKAYEPRLIGLGLSINLVAMILIARFSDISIEVCVKRVNFIIITQPKELMTEKMIEDIFRIIYDCMNDYPRIFTYMMTDVIPEYDENNENTWWVTDEISEVDSVLGLVILNILDSLPSQMIRSTILNYSEAYSSVLSARKQIRYSLRNLSEDYYRTSYVIDSLILNEGVYVP